MKISSNKAGLYRLLPSVDDLLRQPELAPLLQREGQPAAAEAIRVVLAQLREEINTGNLPDEKSIQLAIANLTEAIGRQLHRAMEFSLKPVINATGVILHTNLGRAPLAQSALQRIREAAGRYSNLEYDLAGGQG